MRRSTVLSLPPQLVFPDGSDVFSTRSKIKRFLVRLPGQEPNKSDLKTLGAMTLVRTDKVRKIDPSQARLRKVYIGEV
jgi:hypothetical protein